MMAETTVTTTADMFETIERAAKPKSKQPRYAANAESFFGAITRWIKSAKALEQPDYATDSRRRDTWLLDFWRLEPHLAGVLNSVLTINANRGWTLTGGRNQVYRYTAVLHDQTWAGPSLVGWRPYFTVQSLSYYATDLGVVSEVGRQGRRGPLRALYHTDPSRCKLTGKTKTPLAYYPRSGKRQMWMPDDYFRLCSMPAVQEKYLNLGFCAVSRCLELAKMMVGIYTHDQEMIGARMPKGLLLLQGISELQWEQALKARDAKQDSLERRYFGGVMTLATAGLDQIGATLVALSQLPAGFDKKMFMDLLMYGYALCFGYDPSEFWPVQYGSMGRGTEVETQHRKATGKGGLEFVLAYQENLQRLLPDTLEFMFEQRDEEGQLLAAQVAQAWANVAKTLYEAGQMAAGPLLARDQALSLLAEVGTIPPEWSEIEEEEKVSDVEEPERKRRRDEALASPTVRRAAALFPSQPIIRYRYPAGRVDVLWDCGADALTPSVWRGWRAVEDESGVLWRDPDGEFAITEGDVDRAIDSARRRVGPEFAALLEAKVAMGEEGTEAEEEPGEETEREWPPMDELDSLSDTIAQGLLAKMHEHMLEARTEAKVEAEGEEEERDSLRDTIAQGLLTELHKQMEMRRGGPGSGHHGHAGRPGEVGGSAAGDGGALRPMAAPALEGSESPSEELDTLFSSDLPVPEDFDEEEVANMTWDDADPEVAAAVKAQIIASLAKQTGLSEQEVNRFVHQWAMTSNDADMRSLAIQLAASKEFGVPLSKWQAGRLEEAKQLSGPAGDPLMSSEAQGRLLRAMYDQTQTSLVQAGLGAGDTVRLFRGISLGEKPDWAEGDIFLFDGNALESWSMNPTVARNFGGDFATVLVADVPVTSIISTARTGLGCLSEGEVIVLGSVSGSEVLGWMEVVEIEEE